MTPWFIATQPFGPEDGERWLKYVEWSGLTQLEELVCLDGTLCRPILRETKNEYWPHIVNEDFMLDFFVDFDFLMEQIRSVARKHVLCVYRNPPEPPQPPDGGNFEFLGYDLVDRGGDVSALTNCGGFREAFANSELSKYGLLTDFDRATAVQRDLRRLFPKERHADCDRWAIFRMRS